MGRRSLPWTPVLGRENLLPPCALPFTLYCPLFFILFCYFFPEVLNFSMAELVSVLFYT